MIENPLLEPGDIQDVVSIIEKSLRDSLPGRLLASRNNSISVLRREKTEAKASAKIAEDGAAAANKDVERLTKQLNDVLSGSAGQAPKLSVGELRDAVLEKGFRMVNPSLFEDILQHGMTPDAVKKITTIRDEKFIPVGTPVPSFKGLVDSARAERASQQQPVG